ncbi:aminotransferase class I/II-fold pyridoxal phosphate-dependent enzyme [Macrococcus armenti]|uniref:aminotransferase class I/II-fold pyridoxal phosphate-dependent enzyme n=1 Tax=Macrococcus armenti TaxID=2875764 RepID=UPI001CCD7A8E|nr:aminotransferase class I/II-fold pyridoxal phosphate-dependent enzyme [Macrococcus armenti]UBH22654.1 aminotransferase class I/II-fold pyridoxal phosphate-dependent enzyme [Macrococcus armenti]
MASLSEALQTYKDKYEALLNQDINIDMTRGKPSSDQVALSFPMLDVLKSEDAASYMSYFNYGIPGGIPEAKQLFADLFNVDTKEVYIGGNSSLNLMHDMVNKFMFYGVSKGATPWKDQKVKFLCPVPGYDRHFTICESYGIEMISVDMTDHGPDMAQVEALVKEDSAIKGIWCVPLYSNPQGYNYSDETVERLANMTTAADDFRIIWDNAYGYHHIGDEVVTVKNLLHACKSAGNEDRALMVMSTSKMTFPGAGISAIAASEANINYLVSLFGVQTIGHDKLNQLRHVKFFQDKDGLVEHMRKHKEIMAPKFDVVDTYLREKLYSSEICKWNKPMGGYFITIDVLDHCASEIVQKCSDLGLKVTPAGATHPYGKDPNDSIIRIAPSFLNVEQLKEAMDILCVVINYVTLSKLNENK